MTLQIYNSLSRTKETFEPYNKNEVKMYVCGPTVYDSAHIGHAMSYLVFDMVRRYLESRGYRVKHVQNFTDVDDKIINRAQETGQEWKALTTNYINEFLKDMDELNIQRAHVYPYVSREISPIIEMIKGLIEEDYAYESEGDVYFRVSKDDDYGKLSNRKLEEQQAGTRISHDERQRKEHTLDFALWKAAKLGEEPYWKSPWGRGRPGWHIECSAMSLHYLGQQIDIHGGGIDLVFPHHENEIAQTESYTGEVPFTKYWIHHGLLQVGGEKMSKSLKNFFAIQDFLKHHSADALRLFVLSTHYRRAPTYTEESFKSSERAMERFHIALEPGLPDAKETDQELIIFAKEIKTKFHEAMNDDFNSALALGRLFELARAINNSRDRGVGGYSFIKTQDTLRELLSILGFNLKLKEEKKNTASAKPFIDLLVVLRSDLRKRKQWALADQIRNDLDKLGVKLEDTREETIWKME